MVPDNHLFPNQANSVIAQNVEVTNFVVGVNVLLDNDKTITVGYCTPIEGSQNSRAFENELHVMFNWYFGGAMRRYTPIQF